MFSPQKLDIYSETECEYLKTMIKSEINSQEQTSVIKDLQAAFDKAKVTVEVLVANMVNPDVVNNTFFAYYRQFSKPNLMKLLLRAK